jgi:hypothetical protein
MMTRQELVTVYEHTAKEISWRELLKYTFILSNIKSLYPWICLSGLTIGSDIARL